MKKSDLIQHIVAVHPDIQLDFGQDQSAQKDFGHGKSVQVPFPEQRGKVTYTHRASGIPPPNYFE